jgi:HSP20 family protein
MAFRSLLPQSWRREERPWARDMTRLQRRIDRAFDEMTEPFSGFFGPAARDVWDLGGELEYSPPCDVEESTTHYVVSFDIPGLRREDVKIELRDNQLIVSGERKRDHKEETKEHFSQERYYGTFMRSFTLPANTSLEKIEANYENGVLQISVPKTAVSAAKHIPIKEGRLLEAKGGKAA